jgi:hypothetical protein
MIVQMKKKAPLDLAISPPTPFPVMWRTGTSNPRREPRSPEDCIKESGADGASDLPDKTLYFRLSCHESRRTSVLTSPMRVRRIC